MKDEALVFNRECHVLYSKPCKKEIQGKIALHYPAGQREEAWTKVQLQYVDFLKDWRTDLGGKKNSHNGVGGNYDCIALMAYYVVCKDKTSLAEIEQMEGDLFLSNAKRQCDKWGDFKMNLAPFDKNKPIYYEFTECPTAEFAKKHGLLGVMPALCNPDFEGMELIHARLVRRTTCSNGCKCDYTICGDREEYAKQHPEYRDDLGYRRNR